MHEAHVCAVCRTVLDWFEPLDGSPGRWQHTSANAAEDSHRPAPVPRREMTEVRNRCDYCSGPDPIVVYVLADRLSILMEDATGANRGGTEDADGLWSACAACAEIVDTSSAVKLTARVARRIEASEGRPVSRETLYRMYVAHLAVPRIKTELNEEKS